MNPLRKVLSWYFSKDSLPYWCLLLNDCAIVFGSTIFTFWVFEKTQLLFDQRIDVVWTALFYALLSIIGARAFSTYSGVVRFSSFVDLLHVGYANALNMVLMVILSEVLQANGITIIAALTQTETVVAFVIATLVMWGVRVIVKTLYDIALSDNRTLRVLIYGALSGGVGLAKNIRTQRPSRFTLCGFISHDKRAKHMMLMGKKVYNVDDDLRAIIKKNRIEAILVSPIRIKEFRDNQELQDMLIGAGCKIFMAQAAMEAKVEDGQLTDEMIHQVVEDSHRAFS